MCTPASEPGGIIWSSTSTASCWKMRMLGMSCSPISLSSAPTPGSWTSQPMKSVPGKVRAIWAVGPPMPKPISKTTGALRPKVAS